MISLKVLKEAVETLIATKQRGARSQRRPTAADGGHDVAYDHKAAQASPPAAVAHDHHHNIDVAFAKEIEAAVASLGLSPEEAHAQMESGDPTTELAQEVSKTTGKKAEEVAEEMQETAHAAEAEPKSKGWICMFCGSTNPDCPYKGRPDRERFNALQ